MVKARCQPVPLRAHTMRGEEIACTADLLEVVETPALVRHRQRYDTGIRTKQARRGLQEPDRIREMFDDVAGDQDVERAVQFGWHRFMQWTVAPDVIDLLDVRDGDIGIDLIFFAQLLLRRVIHHGHVPAGRARRHGGYTWAEFQY